MKPFRASKIILSASVILSIQRISFHELVIMTSLCSIFHCKNAKVTKANNNTLNMSTAFSNALQKKFDKYVPCPSQMVTYRKMCSLHSFVYVNGYAENKLLVNFSFGVNIHRILNVSCEIVRLNVPPCLLIVLVEW